MQTEMKLTCIKAKINQKSEWESMYKLKPMGKFKPNQCEEAKRNQKPMLNQCKRLNRLKS